MKDIKEVIDELGNLQDGLILKTIEFNQETGRLSFRSKLANYCYSKARRLKSRLPEKSDEIDEIILTYFGFVTQSLCTYSDLVKQSGENNISPILYGNFAFKTIVKMKSTYDVFAVIFQILNTNSLIPENRWSDISKLHNSFTELSSYWNFHSIKQLNEIRNKIVHRGYDIQFNAAKKQSELMRSKTVDLKRGFKIESIDLSTIVKDFITNVFNLEHMILNHFVEESIDYKFNSLATSGYDEFGVSDINFIMYDAFGNMPLSKHQPYELLKSYIL